MKTCYLPAEVQTYTRSAGLCGEERLKQIALYYSVKSGSVISYRDKRTA